MRVGGRFGIKNITNGFKIIITKTTHVHRITRTGRYLTLIFLINNRNCNIKGSLGFKGLSCIERDSSKKVFFIFIDTSIKRHTIWKVCFS